MGKKKTQQHQTQSFGNMVSKAALAQLGPHIEAMVNSLGQQLAIRQANTYGQLFTRIVALEKLLIEKTLTTQDEIMSKISDVEDQREGLVAATELKLGDVARIEARTKNEDGTYKTDSTRLKVVNAGSGDTLGKEVEQTLIGLKVGDKAIVKTGKNKEIDVEITLTKSSRPVAEEVKSEEQNVDQVQG